MDRKRGEEEEDKNGWAARREREDKVGMRGKEKIIWCLANGAVVAEDNF